MNKARVLLVGGSNLFRHGLKSYLSSDTFSVIGEIGNPEKLSEIYPTAMTPDLVIYARGHGGNRAVEAVRAIRAALPDAPVLVMADGLLASEFGECLAAGVSGYLLHDISKEALLHSIHLLLLGEKVFATELATLWINGGLDRRSEPVSLATYSLTPREGQILECLLAGDSNKCIARRLAIAESTVKIHVKSVLRKINVQNRTQAAIWAIETGFTAPSSHSAK